MVEVGRVLHRFPGGLKLRHHKQHALARPLQRLPIPEVLYLPLVQHQGPPGELLVEPGSRVEAGQPLTRARDDREVPIHAPVAGLVEALVDWPVHWPPGSSAPCVKLVTDADSAPDSTPPERDWRGMDRDALVTCLRDAGLAGLGGAVFPTAAKLRGDWSGGAIHTIILNGAECEPWIACDEALMRSEPARVVEGGLILAEAAGAAEMVIAIEDLMGGLGRLLESAASRSGQAERIRVVRIPPIYPGGSERQLIQVLTGQQVPHDGLPQDLGLVCVNVATAARARDAVVLGRPLTERIVTVTGPRVAAPCNVIAPLGTPISELIRHAGGYTGPVSRLVLGGPLSGLPLASERIPVTKATNCVLALGPEQTEARAPEMPCINCGECVRACPASLLPQQLFHACRSEDHEEAQALNLFDCIECGCCAYVCPSQIPLVDWYRHEKGVLAVRGIESERAKRARQRFEARQQRLARREAERQARREARERRLREQVAAQAEVQAAIERARHKAAGRTPPDSGEDGS